MRVLVKAMVFFCICTLFSATFGYPGEAWSAPKGKLVVVQPGDPTTLDPQMHSEIFTRSAIICCFDGLVRRAFKDGRIQHLPQLATSWKPINDTTWIFHLRKGVKFHNGEDFTAEAVKYTIERMLDPATKAKKRWAFTPIDRVEIVDPHTVKIITKSPLPTLIFQMGFNLPILPPKYFKEKGGAYAALHPVGAGPFKFVRWVKDDELVFEANEDYWDGPPKVKTLIYKPIPEASTRVAALLGGDADIVRRIPTHLIPMINKSGKAKVVKAKGALGINAWMDTLKEGPLQDKRVRQAINYAVDRQSIIEHVLEGYGTPLATPLSHAVFGYDPNINPYAYDPKRAKALLKEAGYGDGFALTFNTCSGRYIKDKESVEAIAGQLAKVGINVNVEVHEWGSYMKKVFSPEGAGPMWIIGWASVFDADGVYYPLAGCEQTLSKWCNKEFQSLLDQARATMDQKRREELYSQAGKIIHEEAPALFLWSGTDVYGVSNRVQGLEITPDEAFTLYPLFVSVKD